MTLPDVRVTFKDGGLGITPSRPGLVALLGVCSLGDVNEPVLLSNENQVVETLGHGELASAAIYYLGVTGAPILVIPLEASTDGSTGSVTHVGSGSSVMTTGGNSAVTHTGTGTSVATLSGTATQYVDLIFEILENGANLASTPSCRYSIDGGVTYTDPFDLASSGIKVITDTGLTLTFAEGTFVDNDLYTARAAFSNPADTAAVVVEITAAAANLAALTAAFKYSLDGGVTFSKVQAIPISGVSPINNTGLVVKFTNASFVKGDTYSFSAVAKAATLDDIQDGLAALLASNRIGQVPFFGIVSDADATIAAGVKTIVDSAEESFKYLFGVLQVRDNDEGEEDDDWRGDVIDDFDGFESARIGVCAGRCQIDDPVNKNQKRRPISWPYLAKLGSISVSDNPIATADGPLERVLDLYHDENKTPELDAEKFVTLRTFDGLDGFFVTRGQMMAASDSDFKSVMNRRVIDSVARVARIRLLREVGQKIKINTETGKILESEARRIDASVVEALQQSLGREASGFASQVDREANLLQDSILPVAVTCVPFGYAEDIEVTVGFAPTL